MNRNKRRTHQPKSIAKILKAELMRFLGQKGTQEVCDATAAISFRTLHKIAHTGNMRIEPHDAQ